MIKSILIHVALIWLRTANSDWTDYAGNIKFQVYKDVNNPFYSNLGDNLPAQGCPFDGNFTFLLFGYTSGDVSDSEYALSLIENFLAVRGGCVVYVDYTYYTNNWNYAELVLRDFYPISNVVLTKVQQVGNYNRIFMYGFSFGARVAVQVGMAGTNGQIGKMHLCEPDAILFNNAADPKTAAKSVECIHTSNVEGTTNYNCHIDWRLGLCGWYQIAASTSRDSHQWCNYFYNSSFTNEFKPFKFSTVDSLFCLSDSRKLAPMVGSCANARMGALNPVDATVCRGEYFVPTTAKYPYV